MSKNINNLNIAAEHIEHICKMEGYDEKGYDKEGYDEEGYDKRGYNFYCYDRQGNDLLDPDNPDVQSEVTGNCIIS